MENAKPPEPPENYKNLVQKSNGLIKHETLIIEALCNRCRSLVHQVAYIPRMYGALIAVCPYCSSHE
jgi:hypothetical protein